MKPKSAGNARIKWLVRLIIGLVIIGLVVARGDISQLVSALKKVPWFVPPIAVLWYWATQSLSALKWRILLRARGAEFSFTDAARFYLLGMFWNLWMPTTIGGDTVRAVRAGARCGGVTIAASSILVERLTGLTALLTVGAIGVTVFGGENSAGTTALPRIIAVLLAVGALFLVARALVYRFESNGPAKLRPALGKLASLHREIDFYAARERRLALLTALTLSGVFHLGQIALNIYLARAAGLETPTTVFLWLIPLLALMSMVPVSIGGLGVREVAAVAILGQNAHASATVVAWSLLWQTTVWLASLPGVFFTSEKDAKRNPNHGQVA